MINKTQQMRAFTITIVVGIGFILMAVQFLDTQTSDLLKQLLGVVVLVVLMIALSAGVAWLIRKLLQRKN